MSAMHVLHIEDDLSDAVLIKQLLQRSSNTHFKSIKNVQKLSEGLKELQNHSYDVVLLDLGLTDVSGIDNLRCLRDENPEIPIIVLTGNDNDKIAEEALVEGAQEFLFKGQSSSNILKRIISSSIIRKAVENRLNKKLHYDPLTKLPNRLFFKKTVETLISKAQRREITEALFFIDLDGFKGVNDTYGHEAGNIVLSLVSQRMQASLRCSDILARYAGDEFTAYIDGKNEGLSEDDCIYVANKLIKAVEQPVHFMGQTIQVSASIGIAMLPSDGESYSDLIEAADSAMYMAKKASGVKHSFAEPMTHKKTRYLH